MKRTLFAAVLCLCSIGVTRADDDIDPEPLTFPKATSTAKSGDYVVTADERGRVTTSKGGRLVWTTDSDSYGGTGAPQVVILGDQIVLARSGVLAAFTLRSGKLRWDHKGALTNGKLSVRKNGRLVLTDGARREVIDSDTGKLVERTH